MYPDYIMFCEDGDALCRCRVCKPPFGPADQPVDTIDPVHVPSWRVVIGSTGLAIVVMIVVIANAVS